LPALWHHDVLRALDYLRTAGVQPDRRVEEVVAIVRERRQGDGVGCSTRDTATRFMKNWPGLAERQIASSRCALSECWIDTRVGTEAQALGEH
jgi:hypothetical protein